MKCPYCGKKSSEHSSVECIVVLHSIADRAEKHFKHCQCYCHNTEGEEEHERGHRPIQGKIGDAAAQELGSRLFGLAHGFSSSEDTEVPLPRMGANATAR